MASDHPPKIRLSARLVPWLRSWRAGITSLDDVVSTMTSPPMTGIEQCVVTAEESETVQELPAGLAQLSRTPANAINLVLAVPGDVRGLPTAGTFTSAALTAGEAIRAEDIGLVPEWVRRTSGSGDTWDTVTWRVYRLPPQPVAFVHPTSVGEADLALTEALHHAVKKLTALDVAAWNPELGKALSRVRDPADTQLPGGFDGRARRLYARALLLDYALEVADSDAQGGAVSAYEASARRDVLRELSAACRQGVLAACHAPIH